MTEKNKIGVEKLSSHIIEQLGKKTISLAKRKKLCIDVKNLGESLKNMTEA